MENIIISMAENKTWNVLIPWIYVISAYYGSPMSLILDRKVIVWCVLQYGEYKTTCWHLAGVKPVHHNWYSTSPSETIIYIYPLGCSQVLRSAVVQYIIYPFIQPHAKTVIGMKYDVSDAINSCQYYLFHSVPFSPLIRHEWIRHDNCW